MTRRKWLGAIAVFVAGLLLAAIGVYTLVDSKESPFNGFPLTKPAFAQTSSGALTFLENELGLSSFTQLLEADIDQDFLNSFVAGMFTDLHVVGDNFIIGTMIITTRNFRDIRTPIFVYVDTDGWVIASLPKATLGADMFLGFPILGCFGPIGTASVVGSNTALGCALGQTRGFFGNPSFSDVNWYHWEFTDATHLAVGQIWSQGTKKLFFAVPSSAQWRDASAKAVFRAADSEATLDGTVFSDTGDATGCSTIEGEPVPNDEVPFNPSTGVTHTIELIHGSGCGKHSTVGVVFVYKFP